MVNANYQYSIKSVIELLQGELVSYDISPIPKYKVLRPKFFVKGSMFPYIELMNLSTLKVEQYAILDPSNKFYLVYETVTFSAN
jgi:hypothetical protein